MKKQVSKEREMKDIRHKTEKGNKDMNTQNEDQVVDLFGMLAEGEMDPEEMLDLILSETDAPVVQENEMPMQQKKPGLLKKALKYGVAATGVGYGLHKLNQKYDLTGKAKDRITQMQDKGDATGKKFPASNFFGIDK